MLSALIATSPLRKGCHRTRGGWEAKAKPGARPFRGSLLAVITGVLLFCVGLLGVACGVVLLVASQDFARAVAVQARIGGLNDPELKQEALEGKYKREDLLFIGGGIGSGLVGVLLARKPQCRGPIST
jgi:hypothetical protein